MRTILILVAALIVAGGAGFYVLQGLQAPEPPAPVAETVVEPPRPTEVYVPAVALPVGTLIQASHLGRMPVEERAVTAEMVRVSEEGEAVLVGSVARQALPQGVPIARSSIVQPGDRGFLAAVLSPGMRAISIPISEVAGLSGLVLPGDRVDIILTYSVSGDLIDAEREIRASETVMRNLRVLALDQRLGQPVSEDGAPAVPPIARTATLEVTPRQAEVITLATLLGELSLVLNSIRDGGPEVGPDAVAGRLVGMATDGRARPMTLDSEVTSLLQRWSSSASGLAGATAGSDNPVPPSDRTTNVQIVRGIQAQARRLALEPTGATDASAAPTTDATTGAPTVPQ